MSRRRTPGLSMSLLDTLFCAFGGVMILAVIYSSILGAEPVARPSPHLLAHVSIVGECGARLRHGAVLPGNVLGVQWTIRGEGLERPWVISDVASLHQPEREVGGYLAEASVVHGRAMDPAGLRLDQYVMTALVSNLPPGRYDVDLYLTPGGLPGTNACYGIEAGVRHPGDQWVHRREVRGQELTRVRGGQTLTVGVAVELVVPARPR